MRDHNKGHGNISRFNRPQPRTMLTDIAGMVKVETEKAFLFHDGTKEVWLPKSQCKWDQDSKTMTMPEWLAQDKGLI